MADAAVAAAKPGWAGARVQDFQVHTLVDLFRQALLAVGPLAGKVGVAWLQEPPYDDWEAATEGLYQSFVVSALENCNVSDMVIDFPKYGYEPRLDTACLGVGDTEGFRAFVRFQENDPAKSKVILLNFQTRGEEIVAWSDCSLQLRLPDGSLVSSITVD